MCRLFAMSAAQAIPATFWLLDAPDSLSAQSVRNPDGCGLGWIDAGGAPHVDKAPLEAEHDVAFARDAKEIRSDRMIAHVRFATAGRNLPENTHPFVADGRLFAHNGAIGGIAALEEHLGPDLSAVRGQTDSERVFALVTREIRECGDVAQGFAKAVRWIAENVPVYALNLLLATPDELFALRYPDTHDLYVLDRRDQPGPERQRSSLTTTVRTPGGSDVPTVVVASEPMDGSADWDLLAPGELLRVDSAMAVNRSIILPDPPRTAFVPGESGTRGGHGPA